MYKTVLCCLCLNTFWSCISLEKKDMKTFRNAVSRVIEETKSNRNKQVRLPETDDERERECVRARKIFSVILAKVEVNGKF